MRVLCVKEDTTQADQGIVVGSWYEVDQISPPGFGKWYRILTSGGGGFYPKICFITEEEHREQQLDKILE